MQKIADELHHLAALADQQKRKLEKEIKQDMLKNFTFEAETDLELEGKIEDYIEDLDLGVDNISASVSEDEYEISAELPVIGDILVIIEK